MGSAQVSGVNVHGALPGVSSHSRVWALICTWRAPSLHVPCAGAVQAAHGEHAVPRLPRNDFLHKALALPRHEVQVLGGAIQQAAVGCCGAVKFQRRIAGTQCVRHRQRQFHPGALQHGEPALHTGESRERAVCRNVSPADAQLPVAPRRPHQQFTGLAATVAPGLGCAFLRVDDLQRHGLNCP